MVSPSIAIKMLSMCFFGCDLLSAVIEIVYSLLDIKYDNISRI